LPVLSGLVGCALPGVAGLQTFTAMPFGVFAMQTAAGLPLLDDVTVVFPLAGVGVVQANAALAVPSMMARPLTTTAVLRRVKDKGISFLLHRMHRGESPGGYSTMDNRLILWRSIFIKPDRTYR
jgi:hypothetical protein